MKLVIRGQEEKEETLELWLEEASLTIGTVNLYTSKNGHKMLEAIIFSDATIRITETGHLKVQE